MDRPGVILVTYIPDMKSWSYEYVYAGTREHKGNLDIFFLHNGEVVDKLEDRKEIDLPDRPKQCEYAIRVHRN